jgi:predicted RecB family nuclease
MRLETKSIRTYAARPVSHWRRRSPLERYEHEFRFRVKVAQQAMRHQAGDDSSLAVRPIRIKECDQCEWWSVCGPQLPVDDLSMRIDKAPLDVREITTLRRLGVATVTDLATIDVDSFLTAYLPQVSHRHGAETRLRLAARRARMLAEGVTLERTGSGPIDLPRADIEIDLDIENSSDERVYLWGFLVHDRRPGGKEPYYVHFSRFSQMNATQERRLAGQAMGWLRSMVEMNPGATVTVYHYSDYEVIRLKRLTAHTREVSVKGALNWSVNFARDHFVDLFRVVESNFFGSHGLGLKQVAHDGPGFTWRDEDPSGLNSQQWFADAITATNDDDRQAAIQRVLNYNEDDVRATWHLRRWLRQQSDRVDSPDAQA